MFGMSMVKTLKSLDKKEVAELSQLILKTLYLFSKEGLITTRMCLPCKYYQKQQNGFYCHLLKNSFSNGDQRLDCPEHEL